MAATQRRRKSIIILSIIAAGVIGIALALTASSAEDEYDEQINAITLGILDADDSRLVQVDLKDIDILGRNNPAFDRAEIPISPIYVTEKHTVLKDIDELGWIYLLYLWDRELLNVTDGSGKSILESWEPRTLRDVAHGHSFECDDGRIVSFTTYPPFKISFNRTVQSGEEIFISYSHMATGNLHNESSDNLYNLTIASFYNFQDGAVKFPSNLDVINQSEQICASSGRYEVDQGYVYDAVFRLIE